jgi:hypothetical protein
MPVTVGREANSGQTSVETVYGAKVKQTRTFHVDIADTTDLLDALTEEITLEAASATAQVMAPKDNGKKMMEVRITNDAVPFGTMQWQINTTGLQERTTTDINGDKILVTYPASLDWAIEITSSQGDTINSFQYTKYESQTGEADKYIPSSEITGSRFVNLEAADVVSYITNTLRPWFFTMNSGTFLGFEKGNVLCMGVDFRMIGLRADDSWICEERFKLMTRPGHPLSSVGVGCGGWNTWHMWKDPNSGVIPDDVWDDYATTGAVVEVQHYAFKDFDDLLVSNT